MKKLDRFVSLLLLAFFVAYTWMAFNYTLLPFEEFQSFRPNTLPKGIGILGAIISLITLFNADGEKNKDNDGWRDYEWKTFGLIIVALVVYASLIKPIGFILATTIFLMSGSIILGERKYIKLLLISFSSSLIIWLLVDQLLSIYLSPLPAFLN